MSGKVVHLDEDTHKKASTYCIENGLVMGRWVSDLILEALDKVKPIPVEQKSYNEIMNNTDKEIADEIMEAIDKEIKESPWSRPPFWKNK